MHSLVLVLFACTCCTWATKAGNLTDIYLIGLFPLSGPWNGGQAMLPASQMAVEDINNRSDILPGYRLNINWTDTQCDAGLGVKALADAVCQSPTKIMIIGEGCSPVSQAVAQAAYRWNLNQISYVSLSMTLSNKDMYPNFFRVVTSEHASNDARMAIFKHFNWRRVATMHESHHLFSTMVEDIVKRMEAETFEIATQVIFSQDPETAVRSLKEKDARIIMAGFYRDKARKVFCHAYRMGFYGKQVWIMSGSLAYDENWWKEKDDSIPCTPDQLQKVLQGTLIVDNIHYNPNETETGFTGMSARTYRQRFVEETKNLPQPVSGSERSPTGYDSVWAAAIILNKTMNNLTDSGSAKTLGSFNYMDAEMAGLMKAQIPRVDFTSVSGRVAFDKNGDGLRLIGVQMIQGAGLRTVGLFDRTLPEGEQLRIDDIWEGDTPVDTRQVRQEYLSLSEPLYAIMTTLACLGGILTVTFLSFNIIYRNEKIIRMSSPTINNIILMGCFLAYISVITEDIANTHNSRFCQVKAFLLLLGFSLAFGALFAKTWRVYAVITASLQMKKRVVKDRTLCLMIAALVLMNSTFLIIWSLVDPQTLIVMEVKEKREVKDDVIIQPVVRYCSSSNQNYFLAAIGTVQGVCLLLGGFLAWETRKVKFSSLNESRYIAMCVYNVATHGVLGVIVSISLRNNITLKYGTISSIIILCVTVTQCLLFVPKVRAFRRSLRGGLKDNGMPSTNDWSVPSRTSSTATQTDSDATLP
ncbi:gamma-aminobutyric acid type B receptor subunit 1-like isoform X1 [Haliotis rufescens]|uniref:gamma-aminobutyric acid type B receptor subunit 1-like isoform X1 n=2 Tax=Haliotis rufescens TaxID=6454 RepID=UPI00201F6DDD|nr:gamma-aminobutyric acid type B receptor subunit 1-like isoform X1 [Haliotis rufescens]